MAFEKYNLGPNSTLLFNNLTNVDKNLSVMGLETWPMISSWPYPPQFLEWMRDVFDNPMPFLNSLLKEALKYNYTGYNIDFEPTAHATNEDAEHYAEFLSLAAESLSHDDIKLSVDVGRWNNIWNYTLLASCQVHRVITMSTYASNNTVFSDELDFAARELPLKKIGIGLQPLPIVSPADVAYRFQQVEAANVSEVDIWRVDQMNASWWDALSKWKSSS